MVGGALSGKCRSRRVLLTFCQVGAEKYREMRSKGETPFPKSIVIESGKSFSIPSREKGRDIPCRIMMPEGHDKVKGVYMHVHGGGWVLQSEVE